MVRVTPWDTDMVPVITYGLSPGPRGPRVVDVLIDPPDTLTKSFPFPVIVLLLMVEPMDGLSMKMPSFEFPVIVFPVMVAVEDDRYIPVVLSLMVLSVMIALEEERYIPQSLLSLMILSVMVGDAPKI